MADVPLYHEKQAAALCGVHCVNSLLQGPFFTEWDMAKMAQDLDELERRLMASQGVNTPEFIKYAAEESGNVAGDGMFSIQVLQKALSNWNLATCPITHPTMQEIARDPTAADGFICHLQNHWFSIRPVAGQWWNFNSLLPAPQFLGIVYLDSFLSTLKSENWTIYVVQGKLPARADESMVHGSPAGRLWSPQDAKAANTDSSVAKTRARGKAIVEDLLSAAHRSGGCISLTSTPSPPPPGPPAGGGGAAAAPGGPSEEEQLAMALAASRANAPGGGSGNSPDLTDEQQLEMAIKASLGDVHQARGGGDAGASTSSGRGARSAQTARSGVAGSADDPELLAAIAESLHGRGATSSTATAAPAGGAVAAAAAPQAAAPAAAASPAGGGPQCELCVRLPNNQRLLSSFGLQATVGDVLAWLDERGWDPQAHRLCTSFPRVPLLERTAALSDCGLKGPREILLLERSR